MLLTTSELRHSRCDFCDELLGGHRNAFAHSYGGSFSRALLSAAGFRVVPSIGQIVEGHLLIVPQAHFCALADMPAESSLGFNLLLRKVRSVLEEHYSRCVFFEHGIRSEDSGGCGIDHAHMHAVPVGAHGVLEALKRDFAGTRIDSIEGVRHVLSDRSSYLFFEDTSQARFAFPVTNLPSQYMRKLVAGSIGKSNWDWRSSGYEPELVATIQHLSPLFSDSRRE